MFRGCRGCRAAVDFVVCLGWDGFYTVFIFDYVFLRTQKACCKYEVTLPNISLVVMRRFFFSFRQKTLFIPACVQGVIPVLVCLCVCQCVCNIRRFYLFRELYEADFHLPGIYGSGRVWANAWDVFPRMPSQVGRGRRAAADFVVCFGWGGFFPVFFLFFFLMFERTRPAACMRQPLAKYASPLVTRQGRENEAVLAVFFL